MILPLLALLASEPAMPTAPPLPGPCVAVPDRRATVRSILGRGSWEVQTHAVPGLDVDGHGGALVLVPPERADLNEFSMLWSLYVRRGDCGHAVGLLPGLADPHGLQSASLGLRDLEVMEVAGDPEGGLTATIYRFDGTRYQGGQSEPR